MEEEVDHLSLELGCKGFTNQETPSFAGTTVHSPRTT
jgi:hypothetical protein